MHPPKTGKENLSEAVYLDFAWYMFRPIQCYNMQ